MDNNNQEKSGFTYTYSAKEQAEIRKIRDKYTVSTENSEDKMSRIRKLDASVTNTAQAFALVFGIIGTLILGCGMSFCMTDIGEALGLSQNVNMFIGIGMGVIGGVLVSLAYPIYNVIVKARCKKIAPEIIRLTDELMK